MRYFLPTENEEPEDDYPDCSNCGPTCCDWEICPHGKTRLLLLVGLNPEE